MKKLACALFIVILAVAFAPTASARPEEKGGEAALTNAGVVKLCKSGLGDGVVLAKIKEAPSVDFKTDTDELVKLKQDGCSSAVIEAMLSRSSGASAPASGGSSSDTRVNVKLAGTAGEVQLTASRGTRQQIVAPFVGYRHFMVFKEMKAEARTKDRRPSILVATNANPVGRFYVVRLNQDEDDNDRSLDLLSPGVWGGRMGDEPEGDAQIEYDAKEERPGLWRLTPKKDLKAGEYGLYETTADLYGFGIDK